MQQLYQNAMGIVRKFGKPDYFICHCSFTCNSARPEIKRKLLLGQTTAGDRPDLYSRVFKLKLNCLMADLVKNKILGEIVEFQKRGLLHAHVLIILAEGDNPSTVDDYNKVVFAKIPDPETQPLAYETLKKIMMHAWSMWQRKTQRFLYEN